MPVSALPSPSPGAAGRLGPSLYRTVRDLRRVLRRSVRRSWPLAPMAPAEGELLRLVDERPGVGVREAAAALRLAPNTVSSSVGRLVHAGLIARDRDPSDARAVRMRTTAAARRRMARWQDRNADLLDAALGRLDASERAAIEASLPALARLAEVIEAMDGASL